MANLAKEQGVERKKLMKSQETANKDALKEFQKKQKTEW
jgi:hypothetical protein